MKLPDKGIHPVREMSSYPRSGMANKVQNLSENKLKRILEYNARLEQQLKTPRVTVSEASKSLIAYCKDTHDPLVPSVWGPVPKSEDPFAPSAQGGCCSLM
ncbi:hypothetical protein INT43_007070 [Umbelopsis isabellina]|uniref:Guanine nucleotide-binding protein subunit gamma n=1 Tax=Mortierella isabellina TaxID=91625 RepID=A0A8H7PYI0_MORIS|nr:hypothetical protein INT43_007070 [Umbelopsis isabellina]